MTCWSRICDIPEILLLQVFNVVPTFLEVSLVAGILAYKCGPAFAGLTAATITLYTLVTFAVTSVSLLCHLPLALPPAYNPFVLHGPRTLLQPLFSAPATAMPPRSANTLVHIMTHVTCQSTYKSSICFSSCTEAFCVAALSSML